MHLEQLQFVMRMKAIFPDYFRKKRVIDIGSHDINGNLRWLFPSCDYFGVDIYPGKNVDIVSAGHELNLTAHTVITCECLEHDQYWKETVLNCLKMASGMILITCASTGRPEHGTKRTSTWESPATTDYYRNLDITDIWPLVKELPYTRFWYNPISKDLYFIGFKNKPVITPSLTRYIVMELMAFYKLRIRDFKNAFKKYKS